LHFLDCNEDVVEKEEPKIQKPAVSVTSASKENPTAEPCKEVSVVKLKKTTAKGKPKPQKKQTSHPDLSLEQHQTFDSFADISSSCCFS
jgi:hypothetical protein